MSLPTHRRIPIVPPFIAASTLLTDMRTHIHWLAGVFGALFFANLAVAQYTQVPPAPPQQVQPKPAAKVERAAVRRTSGKPTAQDPECAFTGKRVVNSLARDDVDAAQKFVRFYEMFSCPAGHLRDAFRCAVAGGAPAPGKALSDRVDQCWDKPPPPSKNR
jgi:hypothetical protein